MRDKISIDRINKLHPKVVDEVFQTIENLEAGWPANTCVRVVQGFRTIEEQDGLYAKGRTAPGSIVTKAKGGDSYHNYGLAFDGVIMVDGKIIWDHPLWVKVVEAFKAKGWEWGGEFKSIPDKPHLQKTFGMTISMLRKAYKPGEYVHIVITA